MIVADHWNLTLQALAEGKTPDEVQLRQVLIDIFSGNGEPHRMGAFLALLNIQRVTPSELAIISATAMEFAVPLELDAATRDSLIDTCGTGGTAQRKKAALNVSTVAGMVIAGVGVPVCKHGNRRITSTSGSFDLLEALEIRVDIPPAAVAASIGDAGFGACLATTFHPAFRHLAGARRDLAIPTAFNVVGPLTNPARVRLQVIGASSLVVANLVANTLAMKNVERALVVSGRDGSDEVSMEAPTDVIDVSKNRVDRWVLDARKFWSSSERAMVVGGDSLRNAELTLRLLDGEKSDFRCLVVSNAAMGLLVSGRCGDFEEGLGIAKEAIDSGAAMSVLNRLRESTNRAVL